MPYSFNIKAPSRATARALIVEQLGDVVAAQPIHAHDQGAAQAVVDAYMALVREPGASEQLSVSVNGSVTIDETGATATWVHVNVNVVSAEG